MLDGVCHQEQINRHDVLHLNLENPINSRNNTIWIILNMFKIQWQRLQKNLDLIIIQCLNDKFLIMGKEKEAAGFALTFAGFEHLVAVALCRQRILNLLFVDIVHFSDFQEFLGSVFVDGHLFIDS